MPVMCGSGSKIRVVLPLGLILTAVALKGLSDSCHIGSPCILKLLEPWAAFGCTPDDIARVAHV